MSNVYISYAASAASGGVSLRIGSNSANRTDFVAKSQAPARLAPNGNFDKRLLLPPFQLDIEK